jgi:hypothetical protein
VALAANRSGRHDGSTAAANRIHGHEIELHARRLDAIEAHLARIGHQAAPLPPPRPASPPTATGGAHDAHRARYRADELATRTVEMPKSILGLAR